MFAAFAIVSVLLNWRKRIYGHKGSHRINRRRDGRLNIWVGKLTPSLEKRIYWKKRGELAYKRYTGEIPFPSVKRVRLYV
jgi:hypothetical protein